ncbi:MAG: preprotein translocase subunit SecD, partial [Acidimicrobiales bacterium]
IADEGTDALLADLTERCGGGLTAPEDNDPAVTVVLADADGLPLCLGPTVVYGTDDNGDPKYLTGAALEGADVGFDGFSWRVNPTFKAGEDGIDAFNFAASLCFGGSEACPFGRLAIALDELVVSAPTINVGSFQRDQIEISGSFDEESANDLALALRYGALPVDLVAQDVRTVSATVGDDVLRSGVIAGLIGLGLVAIYLLAFYRLAGLVAVAGLVLSGLMLWSIIGWLGATQGLAISLAGIVGLIVSIGVSADSNIVYFENVKEQSAAGKRVSTAVERAYQSAISTIVKADVVSLIAAGLLYYLTVGAVKGFALYLGVATILDLVVSLLFMRPALAWLAARGAVQADPRRLGMPEGAK